MELLPNLFLSNPAGLWALAGIPAVILIHFLQRQSEEVTISTLFLLQQMQRESVEGRRFERIRSSVPLWLQILMVLLLTWLITQPRILRQESVQPIAVVLDSSASMSAFKEEARVQLVKELEKLQKEARHTDFVLIESGQADVNLYRGSELEDLEKAMENWEPAAGRHDFTRALNRGRSAVGRQGLLILVSDEVNEDADLPFDADLLAVGVPKSNVGFAGLRILDGADGEAPKWTAMVRNYSDQAIEREWWLASGSRRSTNILKLGPGEIRSIEGPFPPDLELCSLHLAADALTPDDVLPMVRPRPRSLTIRPVVVPALVEDSARVAESISYSRVLGPDDAGPADIVLWSYNLTDPSYPAADAIIFMEHPLKQNLIVEGRLIAENHELINHLNWDALIVRQSGQIPRREGDFVLLWQDARPLIMLREVGGIQQLLFNFDLKGSNALKLPAFIVLIHRYAESIREEKPTLERRVLETGQPLELDAPLQALNRKVETVRFKFDSWDGENDFDFEAEMNEGGSRYASFVNEFINRLSVWVSVEQKQNRPPLRHAPDHPGFLTVWFGEEKILEASTYFGDTREADLRGAESFNGLKGLAGELVERHTESDANWMIWVLFLAFLLIFSWAWIAWRQARVQASAAEEEFGSTTSA
ncbi:MAG: hypothetical protein ACI8UO_006061 [Verrucomicrobiales bacterium]|jgi:hypothetical protein